VHALDASAAEEAICEALVENSTMTRSEFDCARYALVDDRAVAHLLRVSSSLDSMVVGESEIQGQVRGAWESAIDEDATGVLLDRLFRQALEAGKRVRTETKVAVRPVSISTVAADLAREALPGPLIGLARGGEDIEHLAALLPGHQTMLHAPRGAPEIAGLDRVVHAILNPHAAAGEHQAPLFLRVAMDAALGVGREFHHREHRLVAGEDMGVYPRGEFTGDALAQIGQGKEIFGH
jgi:hypothetical protein